MAAARDFNEYAGCICGTLRAVQGRLRNPDRPERSNILYMVYDGYVFKKHQQGSDLDQTSFAQVTESAEQRYAMDGQKMAIDPNNPKSSMSERRKWLFVTTNGGTTWQSVSGVPISLTDGNGIYPGISGIEFDPALESTRIIVFAAS